MDAELALAPSQAPDQAILPTLGTPAYPYFFDDRIVIWKSAWDNPVLQGPMTLRSPEQYAIRLNYTWRYQFFDLRASMNGIISQPGVAEIDTLSTWPREEAVYSSGLMLWEAHGTRLGPRPTGSALESVKVVQAARQDWDSPESLDGPVGYFQLRDDVALVPVHVVVLLPTTGELSGGWISDEDTDDLFDDVWSADKLTVNDPSQDAFPKTVDGIWQNCGAGRCGGPSIVQPDRIFSSCKVQFRKISFRSCNVADDVFLNEDSASPCNVDLQATRIQVAVSKCKDASSQLLPNDGVTTVVFTGSLVGQNCADTLGAAKASSRFVYIASGGTQAAYALSHELGHHLGLEHPLGSEEVCSPEQLMCPYSAQQNPSFTSGQCPAAHAIALGLQSAYWP